MSIVRIPQRKKQWHTTDQRVLDDHRLSWAALGLHQYLCSRPDNWSVSVSHLGKSLKRLGRGAGRDKIYALLRELTNLGYADEHVEREQGKFKDHEWVIYDLPKDGFSGRPKQEVADSPDTAEPEPAQPGLAKPALIKTDSLTNPDSDSKTEFKSPRPEGAGKTAPPKNGGGPYVTPEEIEANSFLQGIVAAGALALREPNPPGDFRAWLKELLLRRDPKASLRLLNPLEDAIQARHRDFMHRNDHH